VAVLAATSHVVEEPETTILVEAMAAVVMAVLRKGTVAVLVATSHVVEEPETTILVEAVAAVVMAVLHKVTVAVLVAQVVSKAEGTKRKGQLLASKAQINPTRTIHS
jgi:hypothetical protein